MAPSEDRPTRFKSRFSLLSLLPARHPPLFVSQPLPPIPPTKPGPRHPTIISQGTISPVHSEYPEPSTPFPSNPKSKHQRGSSSANANSRPPPLDLQKTKMMYPSSSIDVIIDPGTPNKALPLPAEVSSKKEKEKKKKTAANAKVDDPFEFAEVEAGHRYPSWKGGKVDIKPGQVIPQHMMMTNRAAPQVTNPATKKNPHAQTTITTPNNYESVLHNVLLTPTYLGPSPPPIPTPSPSSSLGGGWGESSTRSGKRQTLLGKGLDSISKVAQRSRDSLWMPGKSILKIRTGGGGNDQVSGSIQAMREREEQEMERFRRNVRPVRLAVPDHSDSCTRSFTSGSSPVRETSYSQTSFARRSPGWIGRTEWDAGYVEEDKKARPRPISGAGDPGWRWRRNKDEKTTKQQKIRKYGIIIAIIALMALIIGLCTSLLTKSSSSDKGAASASNSTDATSLSVSGTGSTTASAPSSTGTSSQTLTTCVNQFTTSASTVPSSYPCSDCVPLLASTTNDFSQPIVNGNSTGVGSALQFCALMDVLKETEGNGLSSWGKDASPCGGWSGVSCDSRGRVTGLTLQYPNVPSQLPDTLGNIYALQALHLMGNSSVPSGSFPSSLLSLPDFTTLDIEYTSLVGPIDSAPFSSAKGLTTFVLVNNANLGKTMPDLSTNTKLLTVAVTGQSSTDGKVDKLPSSLTYLDLSYNSLSGQIPSLSQLTNLKTLYLQNNAFTSPPTSFPSSLTTLSLTSNPSLSGAMPDSVCSNSGLTSCDLRSTSLTGGGTTLASVGTNLFSTSTSSVSASTSSSTTGISTSSVSPSSSVGSSTVAASASTSTLPSTNIVARAETKMCGVCQFS
ncbi:hypothetical protein CI109_104302 [Kwoniella shandongensis]|uniref:Leucine-rich repeat-containing N-terminal plant-type domain-containing protein n=1 Tax=Kwoniella shandongensis TaxID=1734106 RepID=A0AAJ8MWA8_9TREE